MDKKNIVLMVLLLVLGLVVGAGGMYVYFDKNEDTPVVDKDKDTDKETENNEDEKVLVLSDEELKYLGESLINKISGNSTDSGYFYTSDYVDYNSIKNVDRLFAVLRTMPSELIDLSEWSDYYCLVKKDKFEKYYKKLFGSSKSVEYEEFFNYLFDLTMCKLDGDDIKCYSYDYDNYVGSYYDSMVHEFVKYDSAKINGNTLEINVKYLIDIKSDSKNGLYSNRTSSAKKIVAELDSNIKDDVVWKNYEDQAGIYKLTFQYENDNWYWVSTQVVK